MPSIRQSLSLFYLGIITGLLVLALPGCALIISGRQPEGVVIPEADVTSAVIEVTPMPVESNPPVPPSPTPINQGVFVSPVVPSIAQVPPTLAATSTPAPLVYVVQRGDWLSLIARSFGIEDYMVLARFNNISDPNNLTVGQVLLIPRDLVNVGASGAIPAGVVIIPPGIPATYTPYPTYTVRPTYTPVGSPTATRPPTNTPVPTTTTQPTSTVYPTSTSYPTYTPDPSMVTPTPYPTATPYPTSTYTPYPTYTPRPTYTPQPTFTTIPPSATPTHTPATPPTSTPTFTPTSSPTFTPSATFTPTHTPDPSVTDTPTPTRTPSPLPDPK